MTAVAVADTGPLIHLGEVDALGLLALVDQLLVPEIVREELGAGDLLGTLAELDHTVVEADVSSGNLDDIDPGETAALAVAIERDAVLLPMISPHGSEPSSVESRYTGRSASSRSGTLVERLTVTKRLHSCGHSSARRGCT